MPCENMTDCYDCVGNCQRCPIERQFISVYNENKKKINKSVMLPSSQYLNIKKGMITSRHVGQSANPKKLLQTGGPGDLITSVERRGPYGLNHRSHKQIREKHVDKRIEIESLADCAIGAETGAGFKKESKPRFLD